ncbi:carbohydrate kinase [Aureisphaera galaxeae]|uniref:carbohydrate kinase family protein n=1 Tax=Aureisphaera galaxeae TaxID=1538023 RepID=UPI0023502D45|nr:carbohydrate kinase [Aureisphaera galaxeae]MDC8003008.1 carbohydrate kinase [Aureisphaera galaxeae]
MIKPDVICFGEILWDVFPDRSVIGGAPLNVALRLASFGVNSAIASCVGDDEPGNIAAQYVQEHGVISDYIASHNELGTGKVLVTLDDSGSASYIINDPVAWDAIPPAPQIIEAVSQAPYFVFGSLALRNAFNRNTMKALLPKADTKIFDVNLRAPHYNISMVYELMQLSDVVKLNDEELLEVCVALGCEEKELLEQLKWLSEVSDTATLCVTQGAEGATLLHKGKLYRHPGFRVEVVDTVGAGDSFLATLIHEMLLKKSDPDTALASACAVGALVASKSGANCIVTEEEVLDLLAS